MFNLRVWIVMISLLVVLPVSAAESKTAIFAGGCFWCTESDFDKVPGVISTTSGYAGGHTKDPTYKAVSAGGTGYVESVKVVYDPARVSYAQLLEYYWRHIDPTMANGQFCDHGDQYRSVIFYLNDEQRRQAEASKMALERNKPFKAPVVTEILAATAFYPAEAYHQNYHERNPLRYNYYRWSCGRDKRLDTLWGSKR